MPPQAAKRPVGAEVAVPLPLQHTLTYRVRKEHAALAQVGARVRVRVGKRKLTGMIMELLHQLAADRELRDIDFLLDPSPLLTGDLLDLARFCADYYLAPIGEVLRCMVPRGLGNWGSSTVRVTSKGAFLPDLTGTQAEILSHLLEGRERTVAALTEIVDSAELPAALADLETRGLVSLESRGSKGGGRYRTAFELPVGRLEEQVAACGPSPKGRAAVEFLATLGRPATATEITSAVDCGAAVIRRLASKGILRSFTQVERLPIDRHLITEQKIVPFDLTSGQEAAVSAISEALQGGEFHPFLLRGVTGSGKSEVYLKAVEEVLSQGRSAILLVPEIALVPALASDARRRFGDDLAILHSAMGSAERAQEWERARSGAARIVLGPRSAVFAPLENLGLVIVDEEQDSSFKQENAPRYNARDLALVRAKARGAVAVLVSATPSLETRHNAEEGKYQTLSLRGRVGGGHLPEGILVDLREEGKGGGRSAAVRLSQRLCEEIDRALSGNEQVILLRNRRGYSPILLCRACGENLRCGQCGLPRTYHRRDSLMRCHYCGGAEPAPRNCPTCQETALDPIGAGTERVEEEVARFFPTAAIEVLDRDAARRVGGAPEILDRFARKEIQILVGTQMVSKGHHYPDVGLTGVISADSYLGFPDFRAVERTYSLLTQLAGRAGRGKIPGRVVIQTYHPDHYAIQAALHHDDDAFLEEEMRFRRVFHYPPYTRMIQIIVRGRDRRSAGERLSSLARALERHPLANGVRFSGPAPAALERLQGYWRFQLLLRHPRGSRLRGMVRDALDSETPAGVAVDVDPQDLF